MMGKLTASAARLLAIAYCLVLLASQSIIPAIGKSETISALEIPVQEELIQNKAYLVSRMVVKVRPEFVWQVLTDYNSATRVFPHLKVCKVLSDHGTTKTLQHEIQPSGLPKTFQYVLEIKETGRRYMEWHRLSGDFREVQGFWKLDPVDGGHNTLVTYATHVNGGLFIPQVLIKRQFRMDIPDVMLSLKNHAERFTQIAARRSTELSHTP